MSQVIQAIYQNGMFRPTNGVLPDFEEGEAVEIDVRSRENTDNPIMKLAEKFYEGLSESDIDEIEKIALDRTNFFGDRQQ